MQTTSSGGDAGGLVGYFAPNTSNNNAISTSYANVAVTGTSAGGLVGFNAALITISFATGPVTAGSLVGGLAGINVASITDSYASGTVMTTDFGSAGGLVGANSGSISKSYATGAVKLGSGGTSGGLVGGRNAGIYGTVTNSFWDTTTSGQLTSSGGTGMTTAQMQQQLTFTSTPATAWDFGNTWYMVSGYTYPLLQWPMAGTVSVTSTNPESTYNGQAYVMSAATNPAWSNGTGSISQPGHVTLASVAGVPGFVSYQCVGSSSCANDLAVNAGTYSIIPNAYPDQFGPMITFVGAPLIIDKAPLTATLNPFNKVYDGTDNVVGTPSYSNLSMTLPVNVLTGKQDSMNGSGTFAYQSPNVLGQGASTVNATGVTVADGNNGGNYALTVLPSQPSLANPTGGSTITAAPLEVDIQPVTKVYDGTTNVPGGLPGLTIANGTQLFINVLTGKQDALNGGSFAFQSPDVLTGGSTVSGTLNAINDGNLGKNYSVNLVSSAPGQGLGASTVTKAPLYVVGTTVADATVSSGLTTPATLSGGQLSLTQSATAVLPYDPLTLTQSGYFSGYSGTVLPATVTVTATDSFTGNNPIKVGDYNLIEPTLTGYLKPATTPLTLTNIKVNPMLYNGTKVETQTGGATLVGLPSGETGVSVTLTDTFAQADASYKTGQAASCAQYSQASCLPVSVTVTATLSGPKASQYTLSGPTTFTTTGFILPDPVLVSGTAQNKFYNGSSAATVTNPTALELLNLGNASPVNCTTFSCFSNWLTSGLTTMPLPAGVKPKISSAYFQGSKVGSYYVTILPQLTFAPGTTGSDYWLVDPIGLANLTLTNGVLTIGMASITKPPTVKSAMSLLPSHQLEAGNQPTVGNPVVPIETVLESTPLGHDSFKPKLPSLQVKGGGVKLPDDSVALN
ncbi:hypothetical protein AAKU67_000003 [Oxalobacteraceae bacterium GrIS 2.11]